MRATSLKYYRGTPLHEKLLEIAKAVTYSEWWALIFPRSQELVDILTGRPRPNQNREFWHIQRETGLHK